MSTANSNSRCIARPFTSESDTSEDKELWVVSVPAVDYIRQAFFGAISLLAEPDSYNPISDVAAEYGSEIGASLTQIVPPQVITEPGYQDNLTLWHIFSTKDAGNNFISNKAVNNGGVTFQNPAADGDQWHQDYLRLRAGSWRVKMLCVKNNSSGKLFVNLPGEGGINPVFAPADLYNSTSVENFIFTADITIPESGDYLLEGIVFGHTSPSSGYLAQISCFNFQRTGD